MTRSGDKPSPLPASRAPVPVQGETDDSPAGRTAAAARSPDAGFLAQLLACKDGVHAYRARRRLDPREAGGRYEAAMAVLGGRTASTLKRM